MEQILSKLRNDVLIMECKLLENRLFWLWIMMVFEAEFHVEVLFQGPDRKLLLCGMELSF